MLNKKELQLIKFHNEKMAPLIGSEVKIDVEEYLNEKGLDGTTNNARGLALASQVNYRTEFKTRGPQGGAWEAAGAEILRDQPGSQLEFSAHQAGKGSGFLPVANNASGTYSGLTDVTNDQPGTIYNESAPLVNHVIETFVRKSVLQGYMGDYSAIINMYQSDFSRRDELLIDELISDNLVTNANVAGTAISGATNFPILQTIIDIVADLEGKGAMNLGVHGSPRALAALTSEKGADGHFGTTGVKFIPKNGVIGAEQDNPFLRGYLSGGPFTTLIPLFVNNGIRDTYAVTGANITALGGGDNTALIVADAEMVGGGTGKSELNETEVFKTPETHRKGAIVIARNVVAGGQVINPESVGYVHIPA